MKKLFLMIAAVAALFATSCVTDTTSDVAVTGGECDVTLSVKAPGATSRTIADGLKAVELTCGVYDADWKYLTTVLGEFDGTSTTTTLSMRLVKGKTYNFVFWAQAGGAPYTLTLEGTDNPTIEVDYSNVNANNDSLDAFYGRWACTVSGTINHTVELTRPFAQINFGTIDHREAKEFGFDLVDDATATTEVTVSTYTGLSLKSDKVLGDPTEVTFAAAALPEDKVLSTNKGDYHWLAMNYILVPEDEVSLAQCDLTVTAQGQTVSVQVPMAPARRNWRTNLVGSLLTEQGNLTIEIKPIPVGDLPDENNILHQLVVAAYNGGEVTLTEDVVLPTALNVTADMTINLNGHNITIDAAYDSANYEASSAIVNNAILTLTGNGEIKATNNYTVRNNGTMVIDGVTVKNGIMNFGELTVESGNISNDRSGKHAIYGNAAKLTINGGTFHNGNPGNAGIFAYGGEVIINGGEFTIADGTATLGWTSCLLDAQGGAKYTIYGGLVKGEIRDYNKNTTVYGGTFSHYNSIKGFIAEGYVAKQNSENLWVVYKGAATVEALVEAISNGAEVVVLTEDITLPDEVINVSSATTIDLNGKSLDATASSSRPFNLTDGANLTINAEGANIVNGYYGLVNINNANLTINGGNFSGGIDDGAFLKIAGDKDMVVTLNNVTLIESTYKSRIINTVGVTGTNLEVNINGGYYEIWKGGNWINGTIDGATIVTVHNANQWEPACVWEGVLTIKNSTLKGAYTAVSASGAGTVYVENCVVEGGTYAFQIMSSGGTIYVDSKTTYTGQIGTTSKVSTPARVYVDNELVFEKLPL